MKRKVTDLKPNEAILISNDSERDAILQLMEDAGMRWRSGSMPTKFSFEETYPYHFFTHTASGQPALCWNRVDSEHSEESTTYPATDFIGSEGEMGVLTVSERDNTISIETSDSQIATFLRSQIDWYESNHDYQIATDTLRCWLDELEGKTEPTQLTPNTPTNEQR